MLAFWVNLPLQTLVGRRSVYRAFEFGCEQTTAAYLLSGTLKCHTVGAINMATAGISAMRLQSQKAKEWTGPNSQSHNFNPLHID